MSLWKRWRDRRAGRSFERLLRSMLRRPTPERLPKLLELVLDGPENPTWLALAVAEQLADGERGAQDLLARIVRSDDWPKLARTRGLQTLAERAHPEVLDIAVGWLQREDWVERSIGAAALGKVDDPAVVPHLEALLSDTEVCPDMHAQWRVMDSAAKALSRWGGDAYDAWVRDRLAELESEHRRDAAISLAYVRHPAAIEPLVAEAKTGDDWAVDLLVEYETPEAVLALCAALDSAPESVRASIAYGLGRSGLSETIPALAELLASGQPEVRFAAARGLRWLEHPEARRVLERYREDPDPDVRAEVGLLAE